MNSISHIQKMFEQLQSVSNCSRPAAPVVQALQDQNQRNGLWLTLAPNKSMSFESYTFNSNNDFGVGLPPMSTGTSC